MPGIGTTRLTETISLAFQAAGILLAVLGMLLSMAAFLVRVFGLLPAGEA
ncbi:hypothetical protein HNO88_003882 [Novosphingobium chloroacetimidivorans]|uniref:Uncharacterized protein n=1 Tax=Novosphingobium chloroacetimidivorans TaxID=1428314 RepID=A0A7W7KEE1_9SPHN|nr:hypothetical protein [Novosphingobium chloroacetimidivorans]MBB4860538.1 hypothetical protein [Novosphingobium chloroacetimidivorans]